MSDTSNEFAELVILAGSNLPIEEFLAQIDAFNQSQLPVLRQAYGNERQAKAVLLKISNVAIGKYQYRKRHAHLVARPFGLVVDPCNSCQLSCPGCIHREGVAPDSINWDDGMLKSSQMNSLLERYGAYGISTRFFNWGEPLLNKKTPEFVSASRRFLMRTSISSNLSLAFDAEALVASGLDYLIMSIDGATQETYQKYRKGGNLALVMENVRRLVEAKKKLNSYTPYLVWQYLLFNHTLDEMDTALQMAKELGVNEINFTNPYDVSAADPNVTLPASFPKKQHILHFDGQAVMQSAARLVTDLDERIESSWEIKWVDRLVKADYTVHDGGTCQWLYNDMVMDALGNLLPCCYVPKKGVVSVFGHIDDVVDHYNIGHYKFTREYFAAPDGFDAVETGFVRNADGEKFMKTLCLNCTKKNSIPNVNTSQLPAYFSFADTGKALQLDLIRRLADWNDTMTVAAPCGDSVLDSTKKIPVPLPGN